MKEIPHKKIDECTNIEEIIIVAGPTASGKSKFAVDLAFDLNQKNGKNYYIINSDIRQIYKEAPILTAQPEISSYGSVDHFLYGYKSILDDFNLNIWLNDLNKIIKKNSNKIPIIVGGNGLYLSALINGIAQIPEFTNSQRIEIRDMIKNNPSVGHELLNKFDEKAAKTIKKNDLSRITRALEVIIFTGKSITDFWENTNKIDWTKNIKFIKYFLSPNREILYKNINQRFDKMIKDGGVEEVSNVLNIIKNHDFCDFNKQIYSICGFTEISKYINNEINLEEACDLSKKLTRNYAKRQVTWFKNKFNADYLI